MSKNKVVTFGEIMLRLSTPGRARFQQASSFDATYGGGEANVAMQLAHLGVPSAHVTRFPNNDMGQAATAMLRFYGVDTQHIIYGGNRLGIYFLEFGAAMRPSKVIYDRAGSAFAEIEPGTLNWDTIFDGVEWFHWTGISPAISQNAADVLAEAITAAKRLGVKISADINYRKNLWKYGKTPSEVMKPLAKQCDVLFASKGDMEECFGLKAEPTAENKFLNTAIQVCQANPDIKRIFNTKRTSVSADHNTLSAMLFNRSELLKTNALTIDPIVDRIGGGDAFVAGVLWGLLTYGDNEEAKILEAGLATSVLKHSIEGDAGMASKEEIEMVMAGETTGKLSR